MTKNYLSPINEIIKDAKKGKMFILVDDKDRENEGDLVIPGSKCNSKNINFMATHGRGLICLALSRNKVEELNLPLMSSLNKARMQTAFTVSNLDPPRVWTPCTKTFGTARTPIIVLKKINQNIVFNIINKVVSQPTPNQTIANGIHAIPETEFMNIPTGSK